MSRSKSNNTTMALKIILLIVSGLAFLSLLFATFKTTGSSIIGSSSDTSTTGAELLKNIGDNGTSEAGQALTAMPMDIFMLTYRLRCFMCFIITITCIRKNGHFPC